MSHTDPTLEQRYARRYRYAVAHGLPHRPAPSGRPSGTSPLWPRRRRPSIRCPRQTLPARPWPAVNGGKKSRRCRMCARYAGHATWRRSHDTAL